MNIVLKDTEVHYSSYGAGDVLVLLHGFLECSEIWTEYIPQLSIYRRIVTIDLPGHGRSGCAGEVHSMEFMAESVHAVLRALKIKKASFVGHSMGGYVSLALLDLYPEIFGTLMLVNSTPEADSAERKHSRDRAIKIVQKNKKTFINMAISNQLSPENYHRFKREIRAIKERAYHFPTEGITAALGGMKIRTDRTETLKNYSGGKIIVAGVYDPLIKIHTLRDLAEECNAEFFPVPGGHLSFIESKKSFLNLCISSNF